MRKLLLFLGLLSVAMLVAAQDIDVGDFKFPDQLEEAFSEAGKLLGPMSRLYLGSRALA